MRRLNNIEKFFEDLGNFFGDLLIYIMFLLLILLLAGAVIGVFQELYNNANNYECTYIVKE
jgi:K+-transporting ATPase A subunit